MRESLFSLDRPGTGEWNPKPHARIIALLYPEISVLVRHMPVLITGGALHLGVV